MELENNAKKEEYNKEYALYNGDDFVAVGTMKEIAQFSGLSYSNVRHIKNRTEKNLMKNSGYLLVEMEDEENMIDSYKECVSNSK